MEQLFGAIPRALGASGSNAEVTDAVVSAAWKRCAGPLLARRALPSEFFENRLVILVEDEIWRRHLEDLAPQMIARIKGYLDAGTVKFLEFRVEPVRFSSLAGRDENTSRPSVDVPRGIAEAAENIADESLRMSFLEAASGYLARQKGDQ